MQNLAGFTYKKCDAQRVQLGRQETCMKKVRKLVESRVCVLLRGESKVEAICAGRVRLATLGGVEVDPRGVFVAAAGEQAVGTVA